MLVAENSMKARQVYQTSLDLQQLLEISCRAIERVSLELKWKVLRQKKH